MQRFILLFLLVGLGPFDGFAQSPLQQSHIEANVPEPSKFDEMLKRDLLTYFKANGLSSADRVEIKLLRAGPTQSGVSYPKFYAWALIFSNGGAVQEGAVRLAAVDKMRFDVTDFMSKRQILASRDAVEKVFPAALVADIVQRASLP